MPRSLYTAFSAPALTREEALELLEQFEAALIELRRRMAHGEMR